MLAGRLGGATAFCKLRAVAAAVQDGPSEGACLLAGAGTAVALARWATAGRASGPRAGGCLANRSSGWRRGHGGCWAAPDPLRRARAAPGAAPLPRGAPRCSGCQRKPGLSWRRAGQLGSWAAEQWHAAPQGRSGGLPRERLPLPPGALPGLLPCCQRRHTPAPPCKRPSAGSRWIPEGQLLRRPGAAVLAPPGLPARKRPGHPARARPLQVPD
mmetsp:Transcript_111794/g.360895  ORF Transcript_111794/g.360895 Transcript_111794/m.360895 type:complete len:214 (+) Transcript_111794:807-1448(+)